MHPLLHSPFLQALGYAIIHSSWQFAFLWLLYFLVNTIFKLSSHQKYAAGLVLELAGFTWFLVTLVFYYKQSLILAENTITNNLVYLPTALNNPGTSLKQQFFLWILRSEQFFPYLSIAYLALLFILTFRWIYAYRYTQQVRIEGLKEIDQQWQLFVQKLSLQLGVKRHVRILLSELVQTPLTVGFFKPLILVPLATLNYLNTQQMEAVIVHELAHIRRYDYLFNLVLAFIEACLFFNPFMQLLHQQLKKERENCCDDWVLKYEYCAASYARALLQIASNHGRSPLLALKATEDKQLLINRIKRIIEKKERTFFNHKHQVLALLVLTTVFSSLSFLSPSKRIGKTAGSRPAEHIIFEPMAAKVKNPLFNPVFFLANSSKVVVEHTKKSGDIKKQKTTSPSNRLAGVTAPPEPTTPPAPAVIAEDENDIKIKHAQQSALAYYTQPVTIANEYNTFFENSSKELEKQYSQVQLERRFTAEAARQNELAEKQARKFRAETVKERDVVFNLEKIRPQLRKAMEQITSEKTGMELIKLHNLLKTGSRRMQKEKPAEAPGAEPRKMDQLELLVQELEWKIDSINSRKFFSTNTNADLSFNIQLPAVVYTFSAKEKDHNFSFQYSTKPRARVIDQPAPTECPKKVKERKEKVILSDEDDETKLFEMEPAPPVVLPAKHRTVYIFKI